MADRADDRQVEQSASTEKDLDKLHALVDGIGVAMLTTRRKDGQLVSRPMAVQDRSKLADLWFVTDVETNKLTELATDPHVNCSFYRDRTREWVSVSGRARISQDPRLIEGVYKPDWKAWFGDEGGARDGGPHDPRLALLLIDVDSVVYMTNDKPRPVVLFEVLRAMATGKKPDFGEPKTAMGEQLGKRG